MDEVTATHPLAGLVLQGRRVLVVPEKPKDQTRGGVFLPQQMIDQMCELNRGEVVLVGDGEDSFGSWIEPSVFPGCTAIYAAPMGIPYCHGGFDYLLLQDQDIVAYETNGLIACPDCPRVGAVGDKFDKCFDASCPMDGVWDV